MSVGGGKGSEEGDLPIYVSDLRPDSVVGKCGQIQVRVHLFIILACCEGVFAIA